MGYPSFATIPAKDVMSANILDSIGTLLRSSSTTHAWARVNCRRGSLDFQRISSAVSAHSAPLDSSQTESQRSHRPTWFTLAHTLHDATSACMHLELTAPRSPDLHLLISLDHKHLRSHRTGRSVGISAQIAEWSRAVASPRTRTCRLRATVLQRRPNHHHRAMRTHGGRFA